MNNDIKISDINREMFTLFDATPEELVACALENIGLAKANTKVNGYPAIDLYISFVSKKENLKESTKLGNLLLKHKIISPGQLQEALFFQKIHPELKIGSILLRFKFCSVDDIEKFLVTQIQIRDDLQELDTLMDRINDIKQKLKTAC